MNQLRIAGKLFQLIVLVNVMYVSNIIAQTDGLKYTKMDEGRSELVYIQDDSMRLIGTQMNETTFKLVQLLVDKNLMDYSVKLNSETLIIFGREGQERTIHAELKPLDGKSNSIELHKKCDGLFFMPSYYSTVNYGCCASFHEMACYTYTNELIIKGNELAVYDGYKTSLKAAYSVKDSLNVCGELSFNNGSEQYTLQFNWEDNSDESYTQNITLRFCDKNYVEFKNDVDQISLIKDYWTVPQQNDGFEEATFMIEVLLEVYSRKKKERTYRFIVPIQNGRPFGHSELVQQIKVNELNFIKE